MTVSPARRAAFEILRRVEQEHAYAAVLLASLDGSIREDDRALCHELVLGVLRNQRWLDRFIQYFAERSTEGLDLPVKLVLRLGAYQLRFLSRIPPSAAVNESVNLIRAVRLKSAAGFVNAVLRRAAREPDYDPVAGAAGIVEKLSIRTSHPPWLIDRWVQMLGAEGASDLAEANNRPPALAFRFTSKSISSGEGLRQQLESNGAVVMPSKIVPGAYRLTRMNQFVRKCLLEGVIYFQDEASQLVAHFVGATAGDRVLDVCAAPGSKASQLAAMTPQARIIAGDLHEHRVRTMRELAIRQRAQLDFAVFDAENRLPFEDMTFDRVLVDAPCSGTGTLRHNPEIRWRLDPGDISELAAKQKRILESAAAAVKIGGRLIYSTCSLEPEENESAVAHFLAHYNNFQLEPVTGFAEFQTAVGQIRSWPHRDDVDGFFVVVLKRRV